MGIFRDMVLSHPTVEYQTISSKDDQDFQKMLNQWRHEYYVVIIDHRWYEVGGPSPLHNALVARVKKSGCPALNTLHGDLYDFYAKRHGD